jgi:hypothetical protein
MTPNVIVFLNRYSGGHLLYFRGKFRLTQNLNIDLRSATNYGEVRKVDKINKIH